MRIIAGTRKGLTLKAVPGSNTRPTTDRIKETLFNIISDHIGGCRFLDVFAGSGAIGLEALSRGAAYCCFIESDRIAGRVIKANVEKAQFQDNSRIVCGNALLSDRLLRFEEPFDVVFMDPPYNKGLEEVAIKKILKTKIVKADTMFIVEASADTGFEWAPAAGLEITRVKSYKTNKHVFLKSGG